ncbi:MAG: hypothetical protein PHN55_12140 [Dysgonamonadaceae bacterium]|nr:hypothetical protein [Dysgonamonadaceae bacterium]
MSKLKLQIQLDTDFEVDLSNFDFEGMNENQIKKELIKWYFAEIGFGEIEISNVEDNSIFDAVQQEIYNHQVLFYEIEFERELNFIEKSKIKEWIAKGQIGKLNL